MENDKKKKTEKKQTTQEQKEKMIQRLKEQAEKNVLSVFDDVSSPSEREMNRAFIKVFYGIRKGLIILKAQKMSKTKSISEIVIATNNLLIKGIDELKNYIPEQTE